MKIYRVERKETQDGPYASEVLDYWLKRYHGGKKHPGPKNDSKIAPIWRSLTEKKREKYIFGFSNLKQLEAWFNKAELRRLRLAGFEIVRYNVSKNDVIKGEKQVIFKR